MTGYLPKLKQLMSVLFAALFLIEQSNAQPANGGWINPLDDSGNEEIEERDIKEIEIERRLKESSELLKKAKQPNLENKETKLKESKPKKRKFLVTLSIVLIISFFTYNLTILFLEDILREVPFAREVLSQISLYTAIFKDIILITIEKILDFIPNLA